MAPPRTIFAVETDGGFFPLFSVTAKSSGDLTIGINSADTFIGHPARPAVVSQKYSIHWSPNSPVYTTIKHTVRLSDGQEITHVALTDAVKKRTGFALVMIRRVEYVFSNRTHISLEQLRKDNAQAHIFGFYDPRKETLVHGLIIGPADLAFEAHRENIAVAQHAFKKFRVIIPVSLFKFSPHFTTDFLHILTFRPEYPDDPVLEQSLRRLMEGRSDGICLDQFEFGSLLLARRFLMDRLPEVGKDLALRIERHVASIESAMRRLEGVGTVLISGQTESRTHTPATHQ
jgi:hypothetical protein